MSPRVNAESNYYRLLFWLETARQNGGGLSATLDTAQAKASPKESPPYAGTPLAKAEKLAIINNWTKMKELGCFTFDGMEILQKGEAPTILNSKHQTSAVVLDQVLPKGVFYERVTAYGVKSRHEGFDYDSRYFNWYVVSSDEQDRRAGRITYKENSLARQWNREGLLSNEELETVLAKAE